MARSGNLSRHVATGIGVGLACWMGIGSAVVAPGATVLFSRLDSLEGWTVRTLGPSTVGVVPGIANGRCVELQSPGGTVLISRDLPAQSLAGRRVNLACLVRTDDITRGAQASSTGKMHLAIQTPQGIQHFSTRWTGSNPWRMEGLVADVPAGAERAVLNLGLEGCSGRVGLSQLSVRNDRRGAWPLPLPEAGNVPCALPAGVVLPQQIMWQDIPFAIGSETCLRVRGVGHEDWPAAIAPIPVERHAATVYLLHAAIEGEGKRETPAAIWTATTLGGMDISLSLFEGRELGALGGTTDLENWKVAWRAKDAAGRVVTLGVTRWPLHVDSLIESLNCRAYRGAAVVTLAVTLVEEPPAKQMVEEVDDDEVEGEEP